MRDEERKVGGAGVVSVGDWQAVVVKDAIRLRMLERPTALNAVHLFFGCAYDGGLVEHDDVGLLCFCNVVSSSDGFVQFAGRDGRDVRIVAVRDGNAVRLQ